MGIVDEKCKCTGGIVVGKEVQQVVFENFLHLTMVIHIKTYCIIYNIVTAASTLKFHSGKKEWDEVDL